MIDPALEKPLVHLQRAVDVTSFSRAIHQLLSALLVNHSVGVSLHQNPGSPAVAKWTRPLPAGFFATEPLKSYALHPSQQTVIRLSGLFHTRSTFVRSRLYRRYLAAQKCTKGVALFFRKQRRLICVVAVLRTAKQGDFSPVEIELLRQIYPQLLAALRRIESLERERSVRANFEEFLRCLPLPTMILRWNLKPLYQNRAAREFCAVWDKGPDEAKRTKAASPIPSEILEPCRVLKQRWVDSQSRMRSERRTHFQEEQVRHPRLPHLRATIQLKQIRSAGVARPHFLITCENLCQNGSHSGRRERYRLPAFARLTPREQEVAQLASEGRSNKEIAQNACLSLQTVKKHLHSVFRKLEVPSRSRLVALLL